MPTDMTPPSEPFEAIWLNTNGINSNKTNSSSYLLIRSFTQSNYSIMFLQEPRLKEAKAGQLESSPLIFCVVLLTLATEIVIIFKKYAENDFVTIKK